MTRILLIEAASPSRVGDTAARIASGGIYPNPQLTIVCQDDAEAVAYFSRVGAARVVPLVDRSRRRILASLRAEKWDVVRTFWTGEKKFRRMKLAALRLGSIPVDVDIGDGSVFRLSFKALVRFWAFRWSHPLPSDHYRFVLQPVSSASVPRYDGEKVLIIQSAQPVHVLRALERMREQPLFRNPRYTVFCRNHPEIAGAFQNHPMVFDTRTHLESRQAWRHLRELRKERFDAMMVFFTGDPSYRKIKFFAFLLGARQTVLYNENGDCSYLSWSTGLGLLLHRAGQHAAPGPGGRPLGQLTALFILLLKLLAFPFRFAWLLIVWLRLRSAARRKPRPQPELASNGARPVQTGHLPRT